MKRVLESKKNLSRINILNVPNLMRLAKLLEKQPASEIVTLKLYFARVNQVQPESFVNLNAQVNEQGQNQSPINTPVSQMCTMRTFRLLLYKMQTKHLKNTAG